MTTHSSNFNLRDEIKEYWSMRAATFDEQPGHEIFSDQERLAWHDLFRRHLGDGTGKSALDLASGTGVISHLMHDLGFEVTGLDWSEAMLEKARAKSKLRQSNIRFILGDAENTLEDDNSYDVIVTRHLVWTLVDPAVAFAEWFRVLKPGGKLLVVDGDFVSPTWVSKLNKAMTGFLQSIGLKRDVAEIPQLKTHRDILARVHFSQGARADEVTSMLKTAGFDPVMVDFNMRQIHRAQSKHLTLAKGLERGAQHRYAICATKP
ncbi:methyltransferase [Thalassospira lucentensis]|uniref:Methyltransferase n=1 Tax=Thalassospira lucentensis TaxID=168935 RepID=A0A154L7M0_9PROT|nr:MULTISPECIES: class I SAM-dependent methyltransferase [Thalassospira]KZB66670.1 methyltransferase [Thalassospira lucentensis]MCH2273287.1 class I SAM-dependent methyltransferase [Thalassospira sp.]